MSFKILSELNINENTDSVKVGNKDYKYLSWAWAWAKFMEVYPLATYEIIKNDIGLPYFIDKSGAMVYTKVTVGELTHEMWLPVLNNANKPMRSEPYDYEVKGWNGAKPTIKTVEEINMFVVNKTVMRCLVKNMAMFGLGLYIYAKEDLPEESEEAKLERTYPEPSKCSNVDKKRMWAEYLYLLKKQKVEELKFREFLVGKKIDLGQEHHKWLRDENILNELITEYKKGVK